MKTYHIVSKLGPVVMISEKEFLSFLKHLDIFDPSYYVDKYTHDYGSFSMICTDYYNSDGSIVCMIRESD